MTNTSGYSQQDFATFVQDNDKPYVSLSQVSSLRNNNNVHVQEVTKDYTEQQQNTATDLVNKILSNTTNNENATPFIGDSVRNNAVNEAVDTLKNFSIPKENLQPSPILKTITMKEYDTSPINPESKAEDFTNEVVIDAISKRQLVKTDINLKNNAVKNEGEFKFENLN
jgi:hypothetical protein